MGTVRVEVVAGGDTAASTGHAAAPPGAAVWSHRMSRFAVIRLFKMSGFEGDYTLSSITGGDRELTKHQCPVCRAHTMYVYRHIDQAKTSSIGDDPEVVRAALHALLAQPGVDTFSMTVRDHSGRRDQVHYVIPRHHLPTFTIE